jgi:hypothetical protein
MIVSSTYGIIIRKRANIQTTSKNTGCRRHWIIAIQNIRFLVEIEFTGIPRRKASEIVAEYFGSISEHVGGGYDKYSVQSSDGRN